MRGSSSESNLEGHAKINSVFNAFENGFEYLNNKGNITVGSPSQILWPILEGKESVPLSFKSFKAKWADTGSGSEVVRVKGPVIHVRDLRTGTVQPIHSVCVIKSNLESDPTQADSDPDPDYDPNKSGLNTTANTHEVSNPVGLPPLLPPSLDISQASSSGEVSESKLQRDLVRKSTRFKRRNKHSDYVYYSD